MEWERTPQTTQEMESEAPAGTMCLCTYANSSYEVEVWYNSESNQYLALTRSGDYGWSSGWLAGYPQSVLVAMGLHSPEELKRCLALALERSTKLEKPLTPLELSCKVLRHIDHLLA